MEFFMSEDIEKETIDVSVENLIVRYRVALVAILGAAVVVLLALLVGIVVRGKSIEKGIERVEDIEFFLTKDAASLDADGVQKRLDDAESKLVPLSSKSGIVGLRASMLLADVYMMRGDNDSLGKARSVFLSVASSGKSSYAVPLALYNAAVCSERLGDLDGAVSGFEKAADFDEFVFGDHSLFSLGRIYEAKGDADNAAKAYQRLCDAHPSSSWANLAKSRLISLR